MVTRNVYRCATEAIFKVKKYIKNITKIIVKNMKKWYNIINNKERAKSLHSACTPRILEPTMWLKGASLRMWRASLQ